MEAMLSGGGIGKSSGFDHVNATVVNARVGCDDFILPELDGRLKARGLNGKC